ncbi:Ig-like domain-containing protein [Yoonia sp. GPGPB17]|uniref:Ig-like domain-containing protein n=1 Tax=Yoonia sp. GPGPB17 TaxID=3026147 RepID=UPI0030BDF103
MWLDLNQDGTIDDATERVFTQNAIVDGSGLTFSGTSVAIPSTAFNGTSYGRMIMQFNANPNLCGTYTFGTTVDFRLDIEGGAENPNAPQPPASVAATAGNGSASLTITPPLTGNTPTEYLVTVQPGGAEITVPASAIGSPVVIPGLTNDQEYTFEVTSVFDFTNAGGDTVPLSSSSSTTSNPVTPDGTAPAAPAGIDLTDATNSGSTSDTITNDDTPSIAGTAEPGSEVEVFVGGVSVGTVTADPTSGAWEFPFADGDLAEDDNVITTTATDPAGTTSAPSTPVTIEVDTTSPTATFNTPSGTQTGPFPASITFSEPVEGLTLTELMVQNGVASELTTTDNMTFTFTVTPTANGPVALSIAEDIVTDAATNGNESASSTPVVADIVAPSVTITGPAAGVTETFSVSFEFTEDVVGFTIDDIVVSGGTPSNFQGTGSSYTVDVTPVVGETVTIDIAGGAAQDTAGNDSIVAETFSVQSGSPATAFAEVEDEIKDIVVGIATRDLQNRMAAS